MEKDQGGTGGGEISPTYFVRRGAVVPAVQHEQEGTTPNGAPIRAGDWVVEHGNDVQEVIAPDAFRQTYERLDIFTK